MVGPRWWTIELVVVDRVMVDKRECHIVDCFLVVAADTGFVAEEERNFGEEGR